MSTSHLPLHRLPLAARAAGDGVLQDVVDGSLATAVRLVLASLSRGFGDSTAHRSGCRCAALTSKHHFEIAEIGRLVRVCESDFCDEAH
jgi:hypothetical protein